MAVPSTSPIVQAHALGKQVISPEGDLVILDNVSFDVAPGEAIAVVGASGSGKSTLLGLLAGLDTPTHGSVTLDGQVLGELDEDGRAALRSQRVGFVFQSFQLLPSLTALENTMLPLELAESGDARVMATEVLDRVGLKDRIHHYPNQLSGGEQQRCAIARAFSTNPKCLFADEPTGNLDSATGKRIIELLFELNSEHGTTLIMATHDAQLSKLCKQRIVLDGGKLVEAGAD